MTADVVLVVEDDEDLREELAFLLGHRGYEVITAENGREGLERIGEVGRPCLVILDLVMPDMDGYEFRAALREDPDLADVPVVLCSGVDDLGRKARSLQATGYLTKPLNLDKLYRIVGANC
jgi:CheY-like chemotaxis protein